MDLSFAELLCVAILAFLVLGPVEMVKLFDKLGRFLGRVKTEVNNFKILAREEIYRDEEAKKIKDSINELGEKLKGLERDVENHD